MLVDHGRRTSEPSDLAVPPDDGPEYVCDEVGRPRRIPRPRSSFNPPLTYFPITHAAPLAADGLAGLTSAADWMEQDPREATPQVWLSERPAGTPWEARRDLLASGPDDHHFVVEIDDDGRAWLRFGDGDAGKAPAASAGFTASYRVGNGAAGNVGAEAIAHLGFYSKTETGAQLQPRNPFPARGGVEPEPAAEAKMFAPHAFRRRLARAIVGADYGTLAQEHPGVQRAAGALVWTGSWYEAQVAVDPSGQTDAGDRAARRDRGATAPVPPHRTRSFGRARDLRAYPAGDDDLREGRLPPRARRGRAAGLVQRPSLARGRPRPLPSR